jgi:hypothetical protein
MKSADAELLAGHQAGEFATQAQLAEIAKELAAKASPLITPNVTPSGTGTTNDIPIWTSSTALGNSVMSQSGAGIAVGSAASPAGLTVAGNLTNFASGTYPSMTSSAYNSTAYEGPRMGFNRYDGTQAAPTVVKSGDTVGWFDFFAYDGSAVQRAGQFSMFVDGTPTAGVVPGRFQFSTANSAGTDVPRLTVFSNDNVVMSTNGGMVGIGTSSPTAKLEVKGTAKFDGLITFAAGQTLPDGGTITSVATTSPLTGSATSGAVTVGLNTSALETTLNGVYAQLGAGDNFANQASFSDGLLAHMSIGAGFGALVGEGTNGSIGTYGSSDSGYGVEGISTSGPGVYATSTSGNGLTATSTSGNPGNFTNASAPKATILASNSADFDGSYYPVSINATSSGTESVGAYGKGTLIGVWGVTEADGAYGLYGSAVNGYSGYFANTGTNFPTVFAQNSAAGSSTVAPIVYGAVASGNNAYGVYSVMTGNGAYGLYGESDGTLATGTGRSAIGVKGYATGADSDGVVGDATGPGGYGVYAHASGAQDATNYAPLGVYGLSDVGTGVLGVAVNKSSTYNNYASGFSPSVTAGVWGDTSSNGSDFEVAGIAGTADDNSAGYFVNNSTNSATVEAYNQASGGPSGLFKVFKASTPDGTCGIGGGGNLTCTGQVKTLATTAGGTRTVETYSMQSPENWMEDFGTGSIERGVGVVRLDPSFADTVTADASYHVFLTPRGDSKGLYVINATSTSFEVRESGGGTSSLSFDYRIVGKRRGLEAQRLVDVTERFNAEQASLKKRMPGEITQRPSRPVVERDQDLVAENAVRAARAHALMTVPRGKPGGGTVPAVARPGLVSRQKVTA